MKKTTSTYAQMLLAGVAWAGTTKLQGRQEVDSCPQVHVFGARETTVPEGLGSAAPIVQSILDVFPGSTAEVIDYPATGGDTYAASVAVGIQAIVNQTTTFALQCPQTKMVLVGYSQGSQIMDTAFCGGPDGESLQEEVIPMPLNVGANVAALIWMGNPRFIGGLPYNVGTAQRGGFAARPGGFVCQTYSDVIQSYCDAPDPFCSQGNDTERHQSYGQIYGEDALQFVVAKLANFGIEAVDAVPQVVQAPAVPDGQDVGQGIGDDAEVAEGGMGGGMGAGVGGIGPQPTPVPEDESTGNFIGTAAPSQTGIPSPLSPSSSTTTSSQSIPSAILSAGALPSMQAPGLIWLTGVCAMFVYVLM